MEENKFEFKEFDFGYLDKKIHESKNKEIILEEDISFENYEIDYYEGGIELDIDNLIIDGNGHTIDAKDKTRIFYCTGKNITLKNITFTVKNESGIVKTLEAVLSDGSAELDLSELVEGEYNITADYAGSIHYYPTKAIMSYQKVNIDVSINVSADSVTYGEAVVVNFTASLDGEYNVTVGD